MSHTPGPWRCDWTRAGKVAWKIVGSDQLGVATILVTQLREPTEKQANARLIAASPCLLKALEGIRKEIGYDWLRPEFDEARNAIAKATGESHDK